MGHPPPLLGAGVDLIIDRQNWSSVQFGSSDRVGGMEPAPLDRIVTKPPWIVL
jgi:hypothetical protein